MVKNDDVDEDQMGEERTQIPGLLTISHFLILIFYTPVAANVLALPSECAQNLC